jgi:hypothetical protein
MQLQSLASLSDADLLARVDRLAQRERRATGALVLHLSEVEARGLHLEQGCASIFAYCTRVLHLSEAAAMNRIVAARAGRRFPAILDALECGEVHLAAVRLLAPILTPENHRPLLAAATHKSKREVEELVARIRPSPDIAGSVRKLPAAKPSPTPEPRRASESAPVQPPAPLPAQPPVPQTIEDLVHPLASLAAPTTTSAAPSARVAPLSPGRYRVQFTASAAAYDHLCRARELLRHRVPHGDIGTVIAMALDLLVRDLEKRKFARTDRPGPPRSRGIPTAAGQLGSRHIPAQVKRAVWQRDNGRCTFTGADGTQCGERGAVEFDHHRPHADGGNAGVENVRLLCRAHNQFEARRFFGVWLGDTRCGAAPFDASRPPSG